MCKVGDKFIIEIEESCGADGFSQSGVWGVKGFSPLAVREETLNLLEKYAPSNTGYEKGLSDAWECMKKILYMTVSEQKEAFGVLEFSVDDILEKLSPQEAIDKLKEWEEKQEIKVGDVVVVYPNNYKACVIAVADTGQLTVYDKQRNTFKVHKDNVRKTGKRIDLTDIFKELEGEDAN